MFRLIYVFFKIRLLSPFGLFSLLSAIFKYGINIMALLGFAKRIYGDKVALVDDNETLTYNQLLSQSESLSIILKEKYNLKRGQKVGFLCRNHSSFVKSVFAISCIGADVYFLNVDMGKDQFNKLLSKYDFDFLIYDYELISFIEDSGYNKNKLLSYHDKLPAISNLKYINGNEKQKHHRKSFGKIVIFTGGTTTGYSKAALHKPSVFNFLNPFLAIITKLKLTNYNTAYIATPMYHGYAIAVLLLFITLGKKIIINRKFDADNACTLIRRYNVEVVTVVPLMLFKMIKTNPEALKSLACIASGGAELSPKLIEETFSKLGYVLYNLYGTSESGLNIIATPQDLKYSAKTIGKKISGVGIKILYDNKCEVKTGEIGQLCIKNRWSMKNRANSWIETGDMGYRDKKGYFYLCGRSDDMIVSAGENVYPFEVEQILITHSQIEDVAVIGIKDEAFGERLKAFIVPVKNTSISKEEVLEWMRSKVARFQIPKEIVFVDSIPYTSVGKMDRKKLNKGLKKTRI